MIPEPKKSRHSRPPAAAAVTTYSTVPRCNAGETSGVGSVTGIAPSALASSPTSGLPTRIVLPFRSVSDFKGVALFGPQTTCGG